MHSTKLQTDFSVKVNFDGIYSIKLHQNLPLLKRKLVEKKTTKCADAP